MLMFMAYVANCTCRGVTPLFDKTPRITAIPACSRSEPYTRSSRHHIAPYHPNEAHILIGVFSVATRTVEEIAQEAEVVLWGWAVILTLSPVVDFHS